MTPTPDELPRHRPVSFEWAEDLPLLWTPAAPELALVATSISLGMPHVEPWVARTVRDAARRLDRDDPDLAALADRAERFARQESTHHAQHRAFNRHVFRDAPAVTRLDRRIGRVIGWLQARLSTRAATSFAAGAEAVAYSAARWVEPRMGDLFRGADPTATSMFLWHLAEEVEHKDVAYDVFEATDGSRLRYAAGTALAFAVLGALTVAGTLVLMARSGRLLHPVAHLRLLGWSVSFAFAALPVTAASILPGSHPSDLADPSWYRLWLEGHDRAGDAAPEWRPPGSAPLVAQGSVGDPVSGNGSTIESGPVRASDR